MREKDNITSPSAISVVPDEKAETQLSTLSDFSRNLSVDLLFVCHIILRRLLIYHAVILLQSDRKPYGERANRLSTLLPPILPPPFSIGVVAFPEYWIPASSLAERLNILFLDPGCGEDVRR